MSLDALTAQLDRLLVQDDRGEAELEREADLIDGALSFLYALESCQKRGPVRAMIPNMEAFCTSLEARNAYLTRQRHLWTWRVAIRADRALAATLLRGMRDEEERGDAAAGPAPGDSGRAAATPPP